MSTLIIPCLGRKIVNGLPQYLCRNTNGITFLEYCLKGIDSTKYENIIITLLKEDEDKFKAGRQVHSELSAYPIDVLLLDDMTSGPAETVYQTVKQKHIAGPLIIKDCDSHVDLSGNPTGNFVGGINLEEWENDVPFLKRMSFLVVNEQGNLLDIIEKKITSEIISLGVYGFQNSSDFVDAYESIKEDKYPVKKLYVSHVISYLIGYAERVFRYVPATNFETWGN